MSTFRVGLEIGEEQLSLAVLQRRGNQVEPLLIEVAARCGQDPDRDVDTLRELLEPWRGRTALPAAIVLNRRDVLHRDLLLPAVSRRETATLVARETERLREEAREELVTAWAAQGRIPRSGKKGRQVRILLAAAPRRLVDEGIALARHAGLDVRAVGTGVPFLFSSADLRYETEDLALAHLGRDSSSFTAVSRGRLVASRQIGQGLVTSSHRTEVDLLSLFERKARDGDTHAAEANVAGRLSGLIAEFNRTLVNFANESGTEPKKILLVADQPLDASTYEQFHNGLGLPCGPLERLYLGEETRAPLAVAAALGLEQSDVLVLRRFKRPMKRRTPFLPKMLSVGTAAGILAAGHFLYGNLDYQRAGLTQEIDRSKELLSQLLDEKPPPPEIDPYVAPIHELLAQQPPDGDALLESLAAAVPAAARLDRVLLTPTTLGWRLEISGRVQSPRASDAAAEMRRLFEALKQAKLFENAEYDTTQRPPATNGSSAELGFEVKGLVRRDT